MRLSIIIVCARTCVRAYVRAYVRMCVEGKCVYGWVWDMVRARACACMCVLAVIMCKERRFIL